MSSAAELEPALAASAPAAPAATYLEVGRRYRWVAAGIVALGSTSAMLSVTAISVAIPALQRVFGATLTDIQWILSGYQLGLAAVIPVSGYLSDRFGSKRVYTVTLVLFVLASLLCGLAWNITSLIGFRVLQGLAGGLIMPIGMTMLVSMTPPTQRGRMMGVIGVPMLLGPALGPTVGGWLLQVVDWKWVFWMNVPTGLLAIVLGLQFLRPAPRRQVEAVDVVGLVLATPGVTALIYGMIQSSSHGWGSGEVLGPIGAGAFLILAFVAWELRQAHPLLDMRVFRDAGFSAAMAGNAILAIALFGAVFLVPLYTQEVQGRSALHAGLLLAAQGVGAALMMPLSGWLTDRYGARPVVVTGVAILAAATLSMSRISPTTSDQAWILLLGVRGLGMGFAMMPAFSAAYSGLPVEAIARATAVFNSLQRIASSFGVALLATVAQARITYHIQAAMPGVSGGPTGNPGHLSPDLLARLQAPLTMGFDDTFLLAGGLTLLGLPAAVLLRRPSAREGDDRLPRSLKVLAWLLGALALTGCGLTVIVAFSIV